jgi:hypothetical protein
VTPEEEMRHWPELIGSFVINFGAVEMIIFQWIDKHSTDQIVRDMAIDLPLNKRLKLVCDLIQRSNLPPESKQKALSLWGEVARISETRNVIAHSPFITHQNQHGFIDLKKMKGVKNGSPIAIAPLTFADVTRARIRLDELFGELVQPW